MKDDTFVLSDGTALNYYLAVYNKLTAEDREAIVKLHEQRIDLFKAAKKAYRRDFPSLSPTYYVDTLEDLEYELQDAWKFGRSKDHHTWWCRLPYCACPKLDNKQYEGTGLRVITSTCPYHGDGV